MTRRRLEDLLAAEVDPLTRLTTASPDSLSFDEQLAMVRDLREAWPESGPRLDEFLLQERLRLFTGLQDAAAIQAKLREVLEKFTEPSSYAAVFLCELQTPAGLRLLVLQHGQQRTVGLAPEMEDEEFETGDTVFLNNEANLVVGRLAEAPWQVGETAYFERYTDDGRLVVKHHDDEVVVYPAADLREVSLTQGDQVRWDKSAWLAFEKLPRTAGRRYFLDDVPNVTRSQIGGQRANMDSLLAALTTTLVDPLKASLYGLTGRRSILLIGPPGCGKTSMARVGAAEVSRQSGKKCKFAVVKPSEWEDPFVGVTQQKIRNCFQSLREAAADGLAVLFLDEIESIGRIRGSMVNQHGDKFLAAFLAELDGFADRSGVAIIAATNRKDLIDPALLERLSDMEIVVQRPDMRGARAIFEIHLPETYPFSPNGSQAAETRRQVIDLAVSRLYSPNAGNELCTLRFRDGKVRVVSARELASGRSFEQICRAVRQSAFLRDVRGEGSGISLADMDEAVTAALTRMASTLTQRNVHSYLSDLPQDIDVVAVEPIKRKVDRPQRFLNVN